MNAKASQEIQAVFGRPAVRSAARGWDASPPNGTSIALIVRLLSDGEDNFDFKSSKFWHDTPVEHRNPKHCEAPVNLGSPLAASTLARLAVELGATDDATTPQGVINKASSPLAGKSPAKPGDGDVTPGETLEAKPLAPVDTAVVGAWSDVLEKLNRTVRAAYLDAQPEVDGSTLVLWFRYGFHHKKAQEQSAQLTPLVRAWLGDGVTIDFRLREAGGSTNPGPKSATSPEDDPFVREVVRRFEGRVTRVKEVSE